MRHAAVPPRSIKFTEDEALATGEVCIRFMEKTMESVLAHETLKDCYNDLYSLLSDVGQDILREYAFDFAYYLYSQEEPVRDKRFAFELEARGERADLTSVRDDS